MRPRQEVLEIFSTFVQFEFDRFDRWITNVQLQRHMQHCLEQSLELPDAELFWVLYWHKSWEAQSDRLARLHLSAYLQEPCYWTAQQMLKKFTSVQYGLADCFQTAIAEVDVVLKGFNPDRGSSLKTYAAMAFSSLLRDMLRQHHEVDLCTPWLLLRKVSKKRFIEALHHTGISATTIAQYRLAWTCFKTLFVRSSPAVDLPKLDTNLWEAVAKLYNIERQHQLAQPGLACNRETIEQWLIKCATLIRHYLYPPVASLNVPKPGQELGEVQDDLPDQRAELLAEIVIQEEVQQRETQRAQIDCALREALKQLDQVSQELMGLYYKEGLTQQQIIQQLQISQPTISRRLTKSREVLLMACMEWSQQPVNSLVTPNLIKDMSIILEEWLRAYYGKQDTL